MPVAGVFILEYLIVTVKGKITLKEFFNGTLMDFMKSLEFESNSRIITLINSISKCEPQNVKPRKPNYKTANYTHKSAIYAKQVVFIFRFDIVKMTMAVFGLF